MTKIKIAFIALLVIAGFGVGTHFLYAHHMATAEVDTPYVTLTPNVDTRVDSVLKGGFNLYRFPIVTDGRPYTIIVEPVSGRPELYASRYKDDVDKLINLLSWWCDAPHCGQSATYDGYETFTFYAPVGDPAYYSWFSVYGDTATQYKVSVVNQSHIVRASAVSLPAAPAPEPVNANTGAVASSGNNIVWMASPAVQGEYLDGSSFATPWYAVSFSASDWQTVQLPDTAFNCSRCSKFYRGKFRVDDVNQNLLVEFQSDDGLELYVNGQKVGVWGGSSGTQVGCVNIACAENTVVPPINIRPYLRSGDNLIAVRVYNGYLGGSFNFNFK